MDEQKLTNAPKKYLKDKSIKITRKKHKKSRVGCPQCRKRKVKCDETLPACMKCVDRKAKCGYLDYDERELDIVKLAHWEAEGADPTEMPIRPQVFNPEKDVMILNKLSPPWIDRNYEAVSTSSTSQGFDHENTSPYHSNLNASNLDSSTTINTTINTNISTNLNRNTSTSISSSINSNLNANASLNASMDSLLQSGESVTDFRTISDNIVRERYGGLPNYRSPHFDNHEKFGMKMIRHEIKGIEQEKNPLLDKLFNNSLSTFSIKSYVKEITCRQFLFGWKKYPLFHCSLMIGIGPFLSTRPELEPWFLASRGICINYIIKMLSKSDSYLINDHNVIPLIRSAVYLDASSVFLKGKVNYQQHFQFSAGPISIVQRVYSDPANFPQSIYTLRRFAEAIIFTAKFIWVPQYDTTALVEFSGVLKEFGETYLKNKNIQYQETTLTHYYNLVEFLEFCLNLFENEKPIEPNLVVRYPIDKLYELMQRWFAIVPTECIAFDGATAIHPAEKVFYVFWFATFKLLEAVISSCRYLFSFFLDGFFLPYHFNKTVIYTTLNAYGDDNLRWTFNYCCRIIAFFDLRISYILKHPTLSEPVPNFFNSLKNRFKAKPLEIEEEFVTSFKRTVIKRAHYPIAKIKLPTRHGSISSSLSLQSDDEDGFKGFGSSVSSIDEVKHENYYADLVHNFNEESSLLNNDYDPRLTDPIFNERLVHQKADLEFIAKYIEDRKTIVRYVEPSRFDGNRKGHNVSPPFHQNFVPSPPTPFHHSDKSLTPPQRDFKNIPQKPLSSQSRQFNYYNDSS